MTSGERCVDIGEQRRNIDVELSGSVLCSRRNVAERRIVLVEKLVVETFAHNFAGPLLDFADVD